MADSTPNGDRLAERQDLVAPKGKRRLKRGCQIGCLVILLLAVAPFVVRYILVSQAERHLAEVKANLPFELIAPEDIPDWLGPMPAEEDNAAPLYTEIARLLEPLLAEEIESTDEGANQPQQNDEENQWPEDEVQTVSDRLYQLGKVWGIADPDDDEELPAPDAEDARKFLERFKEVFVLRDQVVKRPYYRPDTDWANHFGYAGPQLSAPTLLAPLSMLQAVVDSRTGRHDQAYERTLDVLRMSSHYMQEPLVITRMLAMSLQERVCRTLPLLLSAGPPNDEIVREFGTLAGIDRAQTIGRAVQFEAMLSSHVFEKFRRGQIDIHAETQSKIRRAYYWAIRPHLLNDHAKFLDLMGRQSNIMAMPTRQMIIESYKFEHTSQAEVEPYMLSRILLPGYSELGIFAERLVAKARMAQLAMALCRHRGLDGSYPGSLSELPNLDDFEVDPFSGKPFGYRRTEDGFLLWSIGQDLTDDDGKTSEELGLGRNEYRKGGDVVFRVPPKVDTGPGKP